LTANWLIWGIAALSVAGVILRPIGWHEAVWAVAGAVLLTASGLLPLASAVRGVADGTDVYLFLIGMMLLSELARSQGLFDWLAAHVAVHASGSAPRLFLLIYLMGTLVTIFLSNDATAVVLTPAVAAVIRTVKAKDPLPYLLICAFIANAASFVLPISNPANLVIYGAHIPALGIWVPRFGAASVLAIIATYAALRFTQRKTLRQPISRDVQAQKLSQAGRLAGAGIIATALVLMIVSAFGIPLGLPTFLAGAATACLVLAPGRQPVLPLLREISWGILPLVAGLFVIVAALSQSGLVAMLTALLQTATRTSPAAAFWGIGLTTGFAANLVNNLPEGLLTGHALTAAQLSPGISGAALIGVDLGPNLSVTGSLATILWLTALRREGLHVTAGSFLKLGFLIMPPALILALAALEFAS
jgi:arsenical pump membrane protein